MSRARFDSPEAFALHKGQAVLRRHVEAGERVMVCTPQRCDYDGCRGYQWVTPGYLPEWESAADVSHLARVAA